MAKQPMTRGFTMCEKGRPTMGHAILARVDRSPRGNSPLLAIRSRRQLLTPMGSNNVYRVAKLFSPVSQMLREGFGSLRARAGMHTSLTGQSAP
jgi:hypothetical protein